MRKVGVNRRRRRKGMIPDKKKPRKLVAGEDQQKTMTDIVIGKSEYQNLWKKTQSFRTHLDNETGK